MDIKITPNGSAMLVKLSGRMDSVTAPELDRTLTPQLEGVRALTLDITELLYVSSAGLRVILALHKKMYAAEGRLVILNPSEMVMDVFKATGFADIMDIQKGEQA